MMDERYARQQALWGPDTQAQLAQATVAVIGAGGLGSPALLYLAGAGVGRVIIFDDDTVATSNLHRQVIHTTASVGSAKTESAAAAIGALNPDVEVITHGRLEPATAVELLRGADVVLDGTDDFATRYLISWACYELSIPHIWAAILGFDAQLSVFWRGHGPVFEDVFPTQPAGTIPTCAATGALGPVVGVAGCAMAVEALKILTGLGTPLTGTLGYYSGLDGTWEYIPVVASGAVPSRPSLAATAADAPTLDSIPAGWRVIDVRTADEREAFSLPGSEHLPVGHILAGENPHGLDFSEPAIIHCASGVRSAHAVNALRARGFTEVYSLRGGLQP